MATAPKPPKSDDGQNSDSDNDYADDDDLAQPANPILPKDDVQAAFEEIISKARNKELNLGNKEMRNQFIDHYGDVLVKKTQTYSQTLLHLIATTLEHKSLTRCIIRRDKMLLECRDEHRKTALHIAIEKRNYYFLEIVLKEIPNPNLVTILQMECEHARNCIHLAIYHNLKKGYIVELIQKVSETTLCATDQNGLTPLHLAVEYQRSSEDQFGIVQALLANGDGALDKFTTTPRELSVYEYQQFTRNQTVKKLPEPLGPRVAEKLEEEHPENGLVSEQENVFESKHMAGSNAGTDVSSKGIGAECGQGSVSAMPESINGKRGSTIMPLSANGVYGHHPSFATIPEGEKSHVKESHLNPDVARFESQKSDRTTELGPRNGCRKADENVRQVHEHDKRKAGFADKIRKELKLYYLRSTFITDAEVRKRDQLKATRFLHGANIENINLCFDYSEAPKSILEEAFRQSYDHMSFDEVLRYVTFHQIKLQKPMRVATGSKASKMLPQIPKEGKGRSDLTFLFKWLYEKNVRHVLKVTVNELEDPPHSDIAIEESLGWFEVETLDWSRMDLCPETLYRACQNVRELYLRWSGNRIALRAWGEPDGLARLKKLERVHLVWNSEETLESVDRIEQYIKDFQRRLNQSVEIVDITRRNREGQLLNDGEDGKITKRKILVYTKERNVQSSERLVQSGDSMINNNERNLQSNRWLECMDKFADEIQNIKLPSDIDSAELRRDIKVALIDDGVDPEVESLRGKIKGGESFDRGSTYENGPSPYYSSSKGNGTVMAEMICRVCPMAKLYIYKLETYSSINSPTLFQTAGQISAESATLAVKAAVNQNVDIISMSWTVKQVEDNDISISQLGEAIKLALDAGILLFCAAADTGAITEVEFPWSYDQRRIFRIGAATADGRIWGPAGSPEKIDFILPGHNVVLRNPHPEGTLPSDFKELTGSSIATALAAGLAALILHCVRLGAIYSEMEMQQNISSAMAVTAADFQRFKNPHNMNGVLKAIGLDEGQQRFIQVWKRFDRPTQNLKFPSNWKTGVVEPSKLEIVAKLARDFVSGIAGVN